MATALTFSELCQASGKSQVYVRNLLTSLGLPVPAKDSRYSSAYARFMTLNIASRQFGADARRERRRCISILQIARNAADVPKLRDRLFRPARRNLGAGRRTSAFLQDAFITLRRRLNPLRFRLVGSASG